MHRVISRRHTGPAAAHARRLKRLVVEDWWGEAPDRPVSGCGEIEPSRVTRSCKADGRAEPRVNVLQLGWVGTRGMVTYIGRTARLSAAALQPPARRDFRPSKILGRIPISGFVDIVPPEGSLAPLPNNSHTFAPSPFRPVANSSFYSSPKLFSPLGNSDG